MNQLKYRKKPIVVDAIQYTGMNFKEILEFIGGDDERDKISIHQNHIFIKTLEGDMKAESGDFIIKGVKGEFYPCKPDIFYETYEVVEDGDDS